LTPKENIDRLFVAYKPAGIGSNKFLSQIKRKYNVKKAGFSGTLDPFAKGVLIIAFGKYTRLFQFLKKTPKTYRATLWLGAHSETLDIEKVSQIEEVLPFQEARILNELDSLLGDITYLPPKYSAKKVDGKRAYDLARSGEDVNLKTITSHVYDTKLVGYKHPFVTFEITISEGGYIRSMGEILCDKLKVPGCLSALERLREGDFIYEDEKKLNPLNFLDLEKNFYLNDKNNILLGKKLSISDFKIQKNGKYFIKLDKITSILQIKDDKVDYLLNGVNISC
jgi:tRNA pseudouridine55 synthase